MYPMTSCSPKILQLRCQEGFGRGVSSFKMNPISTHSETKYSNDWVGLSCFLSPGRTSVETAMPSAHVVILSFQSLSKCVWRGCVIWERSAIHSLPKKTKHDKKERERKRKPKTVSARKESVPPRRACGQLSLSILSTSVLHRVPDRMRCPRDQHQSCAAPCPCTECHRAGP